MLGSQKQESTQRPPKATKASTEHNFDLKSGGIYHTQYQQNQQQAIKHMLGSQKQKSTKRPPKATKASTKHKVGMKPPRTIKPPAKRQGRPPRPPPRGLIEYNAILRVVRSMYPFSFRDSQRLASKLRKSGADPYSTISIIETEHRISRERQDETVAQINRMDNDMVARRTTALPVRHMTIRDARFDELRRIGSRPNVANSSFQQMFKKRISLIGGPKQNVTISVEVLIADQGALERRRVTMGPYTERLPRLSTNDQYSFLLYTILKGGFRPQSGEQITDIGGQITRLRPIRQLDVRMGAVRLKSALVDMCNGGRTIKQRDGRCVQDYVWDTVKGSPGFKRYDRLSLTAEINRFVDDEKKRPSTRELIAWRDNCHTTVSIYALDPFYNKFVTSPAPAMYRSKGYVRVLCFVCKDDHCYPILNTDLIAKIKNGSSLLKHLDLIQWSAQQSEDRIARCSDMKEYKDMVAPVSDVFTNGGEPKAEGMLIVLPEGAPKVRDVMTDTMHETDTYVEFFHYNGRNEIDGFITHDLKNMVVGDDGYDMRKALCDRLYKSFPIEQFVFANQDLTSISVRLYEQLFGHVPKSSYNRHTIAILDDFYPKALQHSFITDDMGVEDDDMYTFDIAKDYPSVLVDNRHDIPTYCIHDEVKPYDGGPLKIGEYYIDETTIHTYRTATQEPITIEAGFYSRGLIDYLIKKGHITTNDIKYQLTADRSIRHDAFAGFMKWVFDHLEEKVAKSVANQFIGYLGIKYDKSSKGFTSTSYSTACAAWTEGVESGEKVTVHKEGDIFLIRKQSIDRKTTESCSINRHVISGSILKLLELIDDVCDDGTTIHGYNTDAVYVSNPKRSYPAKSHSRFTSDMIGNVYQKEDEHPDAIDKHYRNGMRLEDYEMTPGDGTLYIGGAGCGKTTQLIKDVEESDNPIVLCFTNKAVDNIRDRLPDRLKGVAHTFDSYFNEYASDAENTKSIIGKDVFIDEFSMVPDKWLVMIYHCYARHGSKVNLYGDANQCDPVEGMSRLAYDYTKSPAVLDMCSKTIEKQYIEASARYDKRTHVMLTRFLETGQIKETLGTYTGSYVNICYLNSTRIETNKLCADNFTKGMRYRTVGFIYNGKTEPYRVCAGTPVICIDNMKERSMFNSQRYTIRSVNSRHVTIEENGEKFEIDVFRKKFNLAFCITVYKYQGDDIDTHYNILDANRMSKKHMYTALSRTTKLKYIHIENTRDKYTQRATNKHETISIGHTEYQNGKVYRVDFDDGSIYIGSTARTLTQRLKEHINDPKSTVHKHKDMNPKISLISESPSKNKHKLERIEAKYISMLSKKYGSRLLNRRGIEKDKPEKKFTYKLETEHDLLTRINKVTEIKHDTKRKELEIQYRDNIGKKVKITKRYSSVPLEEAWGYMVSKQKEVRTKLLIRI